MRQAPCLYGKGIGIRKADLTLQSHDFIPTAAGIGFSPVQHRVESGGSKTGGTVGFHIRAEQQVGPVTVPRIFVIAVQSDDLRRDITGRMQAVVGTQIARCQIHADNDIRTHSKCDIHRIVIVQPAVDKHHAVQPDRCKHCRNRHTGTHGKRKAAFVEYIVFATDHIDRHAGKGNPERIEIDRIMITDRQVRKEVLQVLPFHNPVDHPVFLLQPERQGDDITFCLLLFRKKQMAAFHFVAQQHLPVLRLYHFLDLVRAVTDGIQTSDDRSHTGPGHDIDRYTGFLQHFQYPDMRHTLCTATAQHDSDFLAFPRHRRPSKQAYKQKRQVFLHHHNPFI